jgi:hypothetical protein
MLALVDQQSHDGCCAHAQHGSRVADAAIATQQAQSQTFDDRVGITIPVLRLKLFATGLASEILFAQAIVMMAALWPFLTTEELERWGQTMEMV